MIDRRNFIKSLAILAAALPFIGLGKGLAFADPEGGFCTLEDDQDAPASHYPPDHPENISLPCDADLHTPRSFEMGDTLSIDVGSHHLVYQHEGPRASLSLWEIFEKNIRAVVEKGGAKCLNLSEI